MFLQNVVESLNRYRVKYALVGGYAVALHGAIRGTIDVDFVVALTRISLERAEKALNDIGLQSRLPINARDVYSFRKEYIQKRNLTAWSFVNPADRLQVVDILITEDANTIKTVTKKVFGINVKVAAIPDLIAIKKKAGRAQDLEDIAALEKLQ